MLKESKPSRKHRAFQKPLQYNYVHENLAYMMAILNTVVVFGGDGISKSPKIFYQSVNQFVFFTSLEFSILPNRTFSHCHYTTKLPSVKTSTSKRRFVNRRVICKQNSSRILSIIKLLDNFHRVILYNSLMFQDDYLLKHDVRTSQNKTLK